MSRFPVPLEVAARRLRVSQRTMTPGWRARHGLVDAPLPRFERVGTVWLCPDSVDLAFECKKALADAKRGLPSVRMTE